MGPEKSYKGSCFCGAVQLEVTGEPVTMGYCHCASCRRWSAGPVAGFTRWKPEAVKITRGAGNVGTFHRTRRSFRKWCKTCGGHLLTDHPDIGLTDVYAAVMPAFPFEPHVHVNYGESVLHVHDGLPKQRDLPKEMGGSGATVAD